MSMRKVQMKRKYREFIGWVSFIPFMFALLISLVILALVLNELNRAGVNEFHLKNLRDMSNTMLELNAFFLAILIPVIMWIYPQPTQQQKTGFSIFRTARNDFMSWANKITGWDSIPETARKEWHKSTKPFITRMKSVTLDWEGFALDPELKQEMGEYFEESNRLINDFGDALENYSKQRLSNMSEAGQREMLRGLVMMDGGIIGERFVMSLLGIFISVLLMLVLSVMIRITSDMDTAFPFTIPGYLNLFLYMFMPLGFLSSFAFLLRAGYIWWHDVLDFQEVWRQIKGK